MPQHQLPVTRPFVVTRSANPGCYDNQAVGALMASCLATAGISLTLELASTRPVMALPFARNCKALEAYVNQAGRSMTPPVQVSELGDWYETDNYVACESGRVVRYLPSNTEVCNLYGENRWPYTAVDYVPSRNRLKVRTSTCTVLPPQSLPWKVEQPAKAANANNLLDRWSALVKPERWAAAAPLLTPTSLGAVLLVGGLAGLGWLQWRSRSTVQATAAPEQAHQQRADQPLPAVLQEEVTFLLDPADEPAAVPAPKP